MMTANDEIKKIRGILGDHERRIRSLEETSPSPKHETMSPEGKVNIDGLARKIGVDPDRVRELFDIEENTLTLTLSKTVGENESEKTTSMSLLVLLGYKYFLNREEVLASEIKRNVAANRVPVNNFATYLNKIIPSFLRRKGKPGSPKTTYRLTTLGEAQAREILKKDCQ